MRPIVDVLGGNEPVPEQSAGLRSCQQKNAGTVGDGLTVP